MKVPVITRFQRQNYSDAPDWFTRFMGELNQFTETTWNILNKNLTVDDNFDAQLYTFTIRAGAAATDNSTSFIPSLKHTPKALLVGNIVNTDIYAALPTQAIGIFWSFSSPNVNIKSITGLTSGHTYHITVLVL